MVTSSVFAAAIVALYATRRHSEPRQAGANPSFARSFHPIEPCNPQRRAQMSPLCFHTDTNSFSRNSFSLTLIQNARGVPLCHPATTPSLAKSMRRKNQSRGAPRRCGDCARPRAAVASCATAPMTGMARVIRYTPARGQHFARSVKPTGRKKSLYARNDSVWVFQHAVRGGMTR